MLTKTRPYRSLGSPAGFTLVEILVAMAVASILSLGIMTLLDNMSRGTRSVQETSEIQEIENGVAMLLSSKQACVQSFGGLKIDTSYPSGGNGTVLKDASGNTRYNIGTSIGSYTGNTVTIQTWTIRKVTQSGSDINGYLDLNFETTNKAQNLTQNQSLGYQTFTKSLPIVVTVAADNVTVTGTTNCSVGGSSDTFWEYTGGTTTDIVPITPGKLGIGYPNNTSNLTKTLQVIGDIQTTAGNGQPGGLTLAGDVSATNVTASGTITSTGNISTSGNISATNGTVSAKQASISNTLTSRNITVTGQLSGSGPSLSIGSNTTINGNLHVTGSVTCPTCTFFSDRRLKRDIENLDGLAVIERLQGHRFVWKSSGKPDMGVIAQEVEQVLPDLVVTGADGLKSVKYMSLIAPLIEAVKTQQKEIEELRAQIQELRNSAAAQANGPVSKTEAARSRASQSAHHPQRAISGK